MRYLILTLILVLGFILRFVWLDQYPPGVTADEIQQGYSGYSILKTGKDEWGDFLPINPRGFGDYKPPLYSYLTIPFIALLGLNIEAIRLPSVLFGTASILLAFLLSKKLFNNFYSSLAAAFIFAIQPWAIHFSRVGWESNVGVFTFLLAVYFFIKSFERNFYLLASAILFGLTLFTYHSFKVFTILFLIGLVILYFKQIRKFEKKWLLSSLLLILAFFLIVVHGFLFSGAGRRAADAAIYNEENIRKLRDVQVEDKLPQPWGRVINNKIFFLASEFSQNYLGYFSTTFLFSAHRSDSSIFNLPGMGLLYSWQLIFLLMAAYLLIKDDHPWLKLIALWFILAPVPAALTREYMHASRVETLLPILAVLTVYPLPLIWKKLRFLRVVVTAAAVVFAIWLLVVRIDYYLFHAFNRPLGGLKYGYQEIVNFTSKNLDKYDQIIFTKSHSEPQIFVAFYSQMDPNFFQQYSKNWKNFESQGFKFLDMTNYQLGKYYFKNIDFSKDKKITNSLIVAEAKEIPDNILPLKVIRNNYGEIVFKIVETNGQP